METQEKMEWQGRFATLHVGPYYATVQWSFRPGSGRSEWWTATVHKEDEQPFRLIMENKFTSEAQAKAAVENAIAEHVAGHPRDESVINLVDRIYNPADEAS